MLMYWKSKVGVGKVLSMARVMGLGSFYQICPCGVCSVIRDGVGVTCMGHPAAPYLSLGRDQSRPIDFR